ncbi:hypothetical protein G8770_06635 [Aestuariicella hydrocarbonica]|uniref:Uncharacterized protein n=1 Tax=Pseudomaricurvus hydrocarbonicus TaxID=1470433 RepID=A0A9E5JR54_9GAMM|nr:hypothetical protein [Aestuariicella hydrocarbonica]NHO65217.1 hypothetical protein [Aestuariicella hydrocarbonica]
MSLFAKVLAVPAVLAFVACILYVLFGQITVRKLRKNPETKDALGLEYVSGWDIINVAQVLALPKSWSQKLGAGKLSFLYANAGVIYLHTTKVDRFLGALFYWLLMISGLSLAFLTLMEALGVFD